MSFTDDQNDFFQAAVALFLNTGNDHTAAEIAATLEWSTAKARRIAVGGPGGAAPVGLMSRQEHRQSYSKSFRGMESGSHRVWVYGPTRETLRGLLGNEAHR